MSEKIELATILLTDLVGSTRLATTVGPVRADELRDEHFALLREAIETSEGREAKNTGDGLMVAFSSASAAVRCAILMQQMFERRYRRAEQQLHIRIGLGAGESTVQNGDYFGMPSIEAARLCDKAPSDGIFASAAVRMLAGRSEEVSYESVGELELKGFSGGIEAFAVAWAPMPDESGGPGRWPLPALLRYVPTVSYVGREAEREELESSRAAVREGSRRLALISGEPGIGKSRLAAYAALAAHGEGFAVCWGACTEELAVPYEPWIEVCTHLVEHAPQDLLDTYVMRHGGELSRLARNLGRRVPDMPAPQSSDPETERFLLFSAVAGLLTDVSGSAPACVVLDDLHWADGQSVALLKHVFRATATGPLQLIITYRDSDLGRDHPLTGVLADLRQIEGVERVALHGLGAGEVVELMAAAAGTELNEAGLTLAGEIATETDGNPFFVGEVLRSLSESGTLTYDEATGRWRVDRSRPVGLPESVRDVIERRVERLGEDAREVLRFAAVIGRSFTVEVLTELVDLNETRLLDLLEAAVAASLLSESAEQVGQFRFAHALINQTLYEGLGVTRRARMHHRVAQALEELYGEDPGDRLAELALHWRLATAPVDNRKAADYAIRAAQRALDGLAPTEAVKLFGDAIELLGASETAERCVALIGLGDAQRLTGDASHRETLLTASRIASTLRDPDLAASAALANSRGISSSVGDVDAERLTAIERAIELDGGSDPGRRARLLALQAEELAFDPDARERRVALADEAISLARQANDARTLVMVFRDVLHANRSPDTLERRAQLVEEVTRYAAQVGDPALLWWAYHDERAVAIELGQFARGETAFVREQQLADELGQPTLSWMVTFQAATLEMLRGNLELGYELAERAFQLGQEAGQPDAVVFYGAHLTFARTNQGRGDEVIEMLEQSVAAYPGIPGWRGALAAVYAWLGRHDDAAVILREATNTRFEHVPWDAVRMPTLAVYADAAAQVGDKDAARILYELMEPFATHFVYNDASGHGHVRLFLGLLAATLGMDEQADAHLEFARRFHEQNGLLLLAAQTCLGWAEALADRGESDRARSQAERALELAREHGLPVIEERAAAIVEAESAVGS